MGGEEVEGGEEEVKVEVVDLEDEIQRKILIKWSWEKGNVSVMKENTRCWIDLAREILVVKTGVHIPRIINDLPHSLAMIPCPEDGPDLHHGEATVVPILPPIGTAIMKVVEIGLHEVTPEELLAVKKNSEHLGESLIQGTCPEEMGTQELVRDEMYRHHQLVMAEEMYRHHQLVMAEAHQLPTRLEEAQR